jgi:hypothetical protein
MDGGKQALDEEKQPIGFAVALLEGTSTTDTWDRKPQAGSRGGTVLGNLRWADSDAYDA